MVKRNPHEIWLAVVFRLPKEAFTVDVGERLFGEVFPGQSGPPGQVEAGARSWVQCHTRRISYYEEPRLDGGAAALYLYWPGSISDLRIGLPLKDHERLSVIAIEEEDPRFAFPPKYAEFFEEVVTAAFDVLKPSWGFADAYERMGFGTDRNPEHEPHWLTFLGPERASEARRLEADGALVNERPWGGFVVRAWQDPWAPPGSAAPRKLVVRDDPLPMVAHLVCGVDVDAPSDASGRSLVERFESGEWSTPRALSPGETPPERFSRWVNGEDATRGADEDSLTRAESRKSVATRLKHEWAALRRKSKTRPFEEGAQLPPPMAGLRAFVDVEGGTAVVGVEAQRLLTLDDHTHEGPFSREDVGSPLEEAASALAKFGVTIAPGLHLVWSGGE